MPHAGAAPTRHSAAAALRPPRLPAQAKATGNAAPPQPLQPRLVLVASKNPVKVNAVQRALQLCFPALKLRTKGLEAPSGVPDQPHGDRQTLEGARNRVAAVVQQLAGSAAAGGSSTTTPAAQAAPGIFGEEVALVAAIEGGVGPGMQPRPAGPLECFAWVCVQDPRTGAESTARSASFALPPPLCQLMAERGMELGQADDALFKRVRSKHGSGTIGHLSNGALDRTEYYVQATVCALLPYMQPQLYGKEYGTLLTASVETDGMPA